MDERIPTDKLTEAEREAIEHAVLMEKLFDRKAKKVTFVSFRREDGHKGAEVWLPTRDGSAITPADK